MKLHVLSAVFAVLAQTVFAADLSLESAKRDAMNGYAPEKSIEILSSLAVPEGFTLLSYEEEFLLYCRAVQEAFDEDKPAYWRHIDLLLSKRDSIVEARKSKSVVNGDCLLEERKLAINVNYRELRFAMAKRDVPREMREFFGIYLERLVFNYGGGEPGEYENSVAEWREFCRRYPDSRYMGWMPQASPVLSAVAESQYLAVASKWMHFSLVGGYAYTGYSQGLDDLLGESSGWSVMAEMQLGRLLLQVQASRVVSDRNDDFSDVLGSMLLGFAVVETRYFTADVLLGLGNETFNVADTEGDPSETVPLVGAEVDAFVPLTRTLDIDLRLRYTAHYSSVEVAGHDKSGIVGTLSLSVGFHLGFPVRSE